MCALAAATRDFSSRFSSSLYRNEFPVEIQIYTLEGFLRTVPGAHDANHLALKLRQFLRS